MTTEEKNIGTEKKSAGTEEKNADKIVLMDFFAQWCGPCKMQDPIIEKLKEKFGDKVEFKKIDVDAESGMDLSMKYNVHAIPTLIIVKDGELKAKHVGVTAQHVLEKNLNELLK